MTRLVWAVVCLAACAALACGGGGGSKDSPSCASVCQKLSECAGVMKVTMSDLVGAPAGELTPENCAASCESGMAACTDKPAALSCITGLQCTASTKVADAAAAIQSCQAHDGGCDGGANLPECPATDAVLTVSPLAPSDIRNLTPLGNLNPSGHVFPTEHQYFYLPTAGAVTANVPVVSPGHLFAVSVASSEHLSEVPVFTDWDVTLAACDGLTFKFGHMASLADPLSGAVAAAAGDCAEHTTGGKSFRQCKYTIQVELQPGDPLGTAGGNPGQYALDFGTNDTRKAPVAFVNPEAYGSAAYARCLLDYAAPDVRTALEASIQRTVEPRCGSQAQDVAGTAQGNWRRSGFDTYPEDPHLALVHDMIDPSKIAISIGTSFSPAAPSVSNPVTATTDNANRDPSVVVPGSLWCWDLYGGFRLVVDMPAPDRLQAQAQSGACATGPWSFSGTPLEFVR